ncbi:hypothetical protein D3C75_658540 [compost metagenome]
MLRNTCAAMQNQWKVNRITDFFHFFEPKVRLTMVRTMYGTKRRSQGVDAGFFDDTHALVQVRILDAADNVVFLSADSTYFSFYRNAFCMSVFNDFFGHFDILIDWVVGAVDHYRCESGVDRVFTFVKAGTVVQVNGNRYSDLHVMNQTFNHLNNGVEAAHVTSCAFGYAKDYW